MKKILLNKTQFIETFGVYYTIEKQITPKIVHEDNKEIDFISHIRDFLAGYEKYNIEYFITENLGNPKNSLIQSDDDLLFYHKDDAIDYCLNELVSYFLKKIEFLKQNYDNDTIREYEKSIKEINIQTLEKLANITIETVDFEDSLIPIEAIDFAKQKENGIIYSMNFGKTPFTFDCINYNDLSHVLELNFRFVSDDPHVSQCDFFVDYDLDPLKKYVDPTCFFNFNEFKKAIEQQILDTEERIQKLKTDQEQLRKLLLD